MESIKELNEEREKLKDRLRLIDNAIDAFQKVCSHTFKDGTDAMVLEGNDSHKDWYKCAICGYEMGI
jgi:hypothetical protein